MMSDVGFVSLQVLFIFPRYQKRNGFSILLCVYMLSVLPFAVVADRSAFIDVLSTADKDAVAKTKMEESLLQLRGSFARSGAVKGAQGPLHLVEPDACHHSDDLDLAPRPSGDWVAVLEVPNIGVHTQPEGPGGCQSVLDRVRKVMLFGASAIIILAMNPKMVTELDISQLFTKPVILIQEVENVTALLSALASKIKMKVKLTYNTSFYDLEKVSTLTLWATCGRSSGVKAYSEFDGVICLGRNEDVSKADPAHFWNYFFSGFSLLLLLFIMKGRRGASEGDETLNHVENSLHRLAQQAVGLMQVRRYKLTHSRNHDDSDRDTCAVCLDSFYRKQKIRVLPCLHEFHVQCVDRWLIQKRTCPLCKLDIIDQQIKLGAL